MAEDRQARVWIVGPDDAGERLDHFLATRLPEVTRGSIRRLLERTRQISIDGARATRGMRLAAGQRVEVRAWPDERPIPQPELAIPLIATTSELIVIDKPPGIPSHPLIPGERDTVANALVARFPECVDASASPREAGLVHRLDRCTSGVLVAARNRASYRRLRDHFEAGRVSKRYLALVAGELRREGTVSLPLRPMPGDRRRVCPAETAIADGAQAAVTRYHPLARLDGTTLVAVACESGVRHQIRAHLAAVGHPLAGDALYGGPALEGLDGAFLHASSISWPGARYEAELPPQRRRLLPTHAIHALHRRRGKTDELGRC
jgi:23S rRNA pseudouridine1911/1915/1917 synthase